MATSNNASIVRETSLGCVSFDFIIKLRDFSLIVTRRTDKSSSCFKQFFIVGQEDHKTQSGQTHDFNFIVISSPLPIGKVIVRSFEFCLI